MKVVFMGTPSFAVPSLEAVLAEHEVVAVITQPDRRRGRGQQLSFSPIKELALEHDLPIIQPERIGEENILDELAALKADIFVVVAFGQKLPDRLLAMPRFGCVNVHSSLLPKYRGAAPINAAIAQGETITGVTTMYMGSGWDTGDIILQAEEEIFEEDTAGDLHDRLMQKGAQLLAETLRQIEAGVAPRKEQNHAEATFAFKLSKDDAEVDWQKSAQELGRLIRGMNPWPLAHSNFLGENVKIWEALPKEAKGKPGEVLAISEAGLLVGCGEGSLLLTKLQRPNSRAISGIDYINGLRLEVGDYLLS